MKAVKFPKAPAIAGNVWLNGPAVPADKLKGKVRLVYFFSIGEPTSLAALPLLRYYDLKLKADLAVIGVHVPKYEHDEEKDLVQRALKGLEVEFPVVMDNEMRIWRSYRNQFWGQVHIVDEKGLIRHTHAGINVEEEVEEDVYFLLQELGSGADLRPRIGEIELEGDWYLADGYTEHTSGERDLVKIRYEGRALAVGMKTDARAEIEVRMDGKPVPPGSRDVDVEQKGKKTMIAVEGEKHLHIIKEDMDRMHDVEFFLSAKGLHVTGFYY